MTHGVRFINHYFIVVRHVTCQTLTEIPGLTDTCNDKNLTIPTTDGDRGQILIKHFIDN